MLARVAAAAALSLPALGTVLFLNANEPETPPVLPNNARALDPLGEATKQLLEALRISHFNPHTFDSPSSSSTRHSIGAIRTWSHPILGDGRRSLRAVYDTCRRVHRTAQLSR